MGIRERVSQREGRGGGGGGELTYRCHPCLGCVTVTLDWYRFDGTYYCRHRPAPSVEGVGA